jgi:hypothetical protein
MDNAINELEKQNPNIMKLIRAELTKSNNQSEIDNAAKFQKYEAASNAKINCILTVKNLAEVTSWMNGSIMLSYLSQKHGANDYIAAELEFCGVEYYLIDKKAKLSKKEKANHELGMQTKNWYGQSIKTLK